MPALASCYFCGAAVGASLDEYDLPENAPADEQVTVTLCARCEGKLSELLDEMTLSATDATPAPVFEADSSTESADADDSNAAGPSTSPVADDSTADPDLDTVAGEQEPIFADEEGTLLDDGSVDSSGDDEQFVGDDAPFGGTASEDADATPADSDTDPTDTDADSEPGPATDTTDTETDDDAEADDDPIAAPPADDSDDNPADEADGGVTETGADSDAGTDSTQGTEADTEPDGAADPVRGDGSSDADGEAVNDGAQDAAAADDDADAGREAAAVEAGTGGTGTASRGASAESAATAGESVADGPLADVSPRTYNRVVRLLQNREFPVDRADFEALATSAYELDHGECAAALDGAIEKGLLEERCGELHRPE